jgi:glycosyltransferase involved in cell wall biosynthesis
MKVASQTVPRVSVAVTSYSLRRLNDLKELLVILSKQTFKDFEIVILIEKSIELEVAINDFISRTGLSNARTVFIQGELGQSRARNIAVANCVAEIIAFIDDDAIPAVDWVENIAKIMADGSVIALTGATLPLWETSGADWFPKEFYWIVSCTEFTGWKSTREVDRLWGVNMAFRREAMLYTSFKHGHVASESGKSGIEGDDVGFGIELALRSSKRLLFEPKVRVYHRITSGRLSLNYIRRKGFWLGFTRRAFRRTYGDVSKRTLDNESIIVAARFMAMSLFSLAKNPVRSWKRLSLASFVLLFVALGFAVEAGRPLYATG